MSNPPGMNPLKSIRLTACLTQKEIAQATDPPVTPQVVLRAEQGLFSAPPPALIRALSSVSGLSPSQLIQQYYAWVYLTRSYNSGSKVVEKALNHFNENPYQRFDWLTFRKHILGLSVAGTAKLMVLQISLLQDLERTGRNAAQVQDILLTWGFPIERINYHPKGTLLERSANA